MQVRQSDLLALAARYCKQLAAPPAASSSPGAPDIAAAAACLEQDLGSCGVAARIHQHGPGRISLVARLPAARPSGTVTPPFGHAAPVNGPLLLTAALDRDGTGAFGRAPAAVFAAIAAQIGRMGLELRRDVFLTLTAGEGLDRGGFDRARLPADHAGEIEAIKAGAALTGGGWSLRVMGRSFQAYQHAELGRAVFHLIARGSPGHGCPDGNHPIILLGKALAALGQWECPVHVTPGFQACVEALAAPHTIPASSYVRSLLNPLLTREAVSRVVRDPRTKSRLMAQASNSFRPTSLSALCSQEGQPGSAEATIECRLLPGQTAATARAELEELLRGSELPTRESDGCWLDLITAGESPALESPPHTELTRAMERALRRRRPGIALVPVMDAADTGAGHLRSLGIPVYGFFPGTFAAPRSGEGRPAGRRADAASKGGEPRSPRGLELAANVLWDVVALYAGASEAVAQATAPVQRS